MSEKVIQVEELEGGLRAAFVNLPHFRTSSARLTINSGSLHEGDDTAGAAHFLEHITFQGTEGLPNDEVSRSYREENGLHINALTGPTETFYMSDGYDLRSVGYSVIQTALSPLLSKESLEKERKPIADEIRGYESNPYFHCNVSHNLAVGGERYARPITGSIEDVLKITHDQLKSYYDRNYRLGNAVLVICSSESIESQRDYAESLIAEVTQPETDQPTAVDLPVFNPKTEIASLQLVNLPLSAQTSLSIAYELPETSTLEEQLNHTLISNVLSKLVHRRLRGDLALCYDAQAHTNRLSNQYFDANRNWSTLMLTVNLDGSDSIKALDSIADDVLAEDLPSDVIESMLKILRHNTDRILESNPVTIADVVRGRLSNSRRTQIDLSELVNFADGLSIDKLRKTHRDIVDSKPLVIATSPDIAVLEKVGDWASSRSKN